MFLKMPITVLNQPKKLNILFSLKTINNQNLVYIFHKLKHKKILKITQNQQHSNQTV